MKKVSGATRRAGHTVVLVEEDALPPGNDWAFIDTGRVLYLAVKRQHWSPELLAEAWADYRDRAVA